MICLALALLLSDTFISAIELGLWWLPQLSLIWEVEDRFFHLRNFWLNQGEIALSQKV
jgi:hypothetical protein